MAYNFLNTPWSERTGLEKGVILVGSAVALYGISRGVKKVRANQQIRQNIAQRQNTITVQRTIDWWDGSTMIVNDTISITDVATKIHDAFYNNDWFGITEDETTAVQQLSRVPREYVPELATEYLSLFGKNLYSDFTRLIDIDYLRESGAYELLQ